MSDAISRFETMGFDDFEELLLDKPDNERWELIGGRVIRSMVGARWEHHILAQNISTAFRAASKQSRRPCRVFQETFYLKERKLDLSVLPDVMVTCGPIESGATSISTPVVLVEILSPRPEARDRYEKWALYRDLPSLGHYVLVVRDKPLVEIRTRVGDGWTAEVIEGLEGVMRLPALDFAMPLAAVYEDVLGGSAG